MSFPKGLACKLIPKYMGPYRILEDFGNNSYRVEIPASMKQRGIHDVFYAALMRIHVPNDDHLFPGHLDSQIVPVDQEPEPEWAADKITHHVGTGESAMFQVLWKSGNETWVPYAQIHDLNLIEPYLEALGIGNLANLPYGSGAPPHDPQIYTGHLKLLSEEIKPDLLSAPHNHPHQVLNSLTLAIIAMLYRSHSNKDQLSLPSHIHLDSKKSSYLLYDKHREEPYTLQAAQLDLYVAFDHLERSQISGDQPRSCMGTSPT